MDGWQLVLEERNVTGYWLWLPVLVPGGHEGYWLLILGWSSHESWSSATGEVGQVAQATRASGPGTRATGPGTGLGNAGKPKRLGILENGSASEPTSERSG